MRASDQLKDLYARISFLRMATPRIPRDRFFRGGAGSFVLRDGELVPGTAAKDKRCSPAATPLHCRSASNVCCPQATASPQALRPEQKLLAQHRFCVVTCHENNCQVQHKF